MGLSKVFCCCCGGSDKGKNEGFGFDPMAAKKEIQIKVLVEALGPLWPGVDLEKKGYISADKLHGLIKDLLDTIGQAELYDESKVNIIAYQVNPTGNFN